MITFKGNLTMRKALLALAALLFVTSVQAQTQTKSFLESLTAAQIPDNITNAVAPANLRTVLLSLIPSVCTIVDANNCPLSALTGFGSGVQTLLGGAATGTGGPVGSTSPTLVTPNLGTPASAILTHATGLPNSGLLNPSFILGATSIPLGGTATTIVGLVSVTSTAFIGALTGHASVDMPLTGGSFTGPVSFPSAVGAAAPTLFTPGSAPSGTPPNGSAWMTSAGLFYEAGGAAIGPLAGSTQLPVIPPQQRLTLTTALPYLVSPVNAGATVFETPTPQGSLIPLWNGTTFVDTVCPETSNVLANSSVGNAGPAAAVAASVYDYYEWNNAGTCTLTRSPAWTNTTTRSAGAAQTAVNGIKTNSVAITNGPGVGFGTFVGTIATDAGGATVTFNPAPAAASGGPALGAWVGLWNQYNRVPVSASIQDNKASWTYGSATWHEADASVNNQITFVTGAAEDGVSAAYSALSSNASGNVGYIGIGLNSTTSPLVGFAMASATGATTVASGTAAASTAPMLGQNFMAALEAAGAGTATFDGVSTTPAANVMQLTAQLRY